MGEGFPPTRRVHPPRWSPATRARVLTANEPRSPERSDGMLDLKRSSAAALRAGNWANDGRRGRGRGGTG